MAGDLTVLDGNTFFVSDSAGDVEPGPDPNGFFHADMRHLSSWRLLINGQPLYVLTSRAVDYYSAAIFGTLATAGVGENPPISIRRDRFVAVGVHEDLTIQNHSDQPQSLTIDVEYGSDFADLFEVKDHAPRRGQIRAEVSTDHLRLIYKRDDFRRETIITFGEPFAVEPERAHAELTLEPRGEWRACIDIAPVGTGEMYRLRHGERAFGNHKPDMPIVRAVDGAGADAHHRQRCPASHLSSEPGRPRGAAVPPAEGPLLFAAGRRPSVVHGAVRSRQPDHGIPGATLPAAFGSHHPRGAEPLASE